MTHCFSRGHCPDLKLSVASPLPRPAAPGALENFFPVLTLLSRLPFGRRTELPSSVKISQVSPFGKKHSHQGPRDGCFCVHLGRGHLQLGFMRSKRVMKPNIVCTLECVGGLSWGDGPQGFISCSWAPWSWPGVTLCSCWLSQLLC